ncbi:unnamed protein product [Closterium sp. NIES-53]
MCNVTRLEVDSPHIVLVDFLRVFGCMGLVHVPMEKRDKLQAAAEWAVHLEVSHDLGGAEGEAADVEGVLQQGEAPVVERGDTEEEVQQPTPSPKLPPRLTTQRMRDAVRGGAKEGAAKERPKRFPQSISSSASGSVRTFPVVRLHSDRGGEFSSDLLRDFCCGEGILQSFTLPDSPQQNGIAERRIGLVMEAARTSMIHAAAPHFLWPFAVRYAAHQLNLWPRVSLLETSPTLRWMGEVGDASLFRVWGSRAFVRDTFADKLSACSIPCVFLGFSPDAPSWQFYHPTSRRVFPSQDVTFDKSVPFYWLFPYRSAPPPPPSLFLAPSPPPVDPLPHQGPAPSGAARGAASGGVASGGAKPGGAEPGGAESEGAGSGGAEPGGAEPGGAEPTGVESRGAEPEGVVPRGAESGGAVPRVGDSRAGGAGVTTEAGGTRGAEAAGSGITMELPRLVVLGALELETLHILELLGLEALELEALALVALQLEELEQLALELEALAQEALELDVLELGVMCLVVLSQPLLQPASALPAPSPYTEQTGGLTERPELATCPTSPVHTGRCIPRPNLLLSHAHMLWHFVSPTPKMTTPRVLLHLAAQRDYKLRSQDFSTAFLQGSLLEEIWLRRPPGFTGLFPAGLAALGFTPSTTDPSLFLRTDTSLPPFYVLVYIDDLVFATADTEALTLVKSELQKRHTCTDLGPSALWLPVLLATAHSSIYRPLALRSTFGKSVEPSGPYPELVGCLMYVMTCTRPDLAYPLNLLARYVAP